jgi:hypothetical protein
VTTMLFTRIGAIGLILYLLSQGWAYFGPKKPQVGPLRRQVADHVIPKIVDDLRNSRQNIQSVVLLHLVNDPSDYVTDQLRVAIEQSGVVDLRDRTFLEKVRNKLGFRHPASDSLEYAVGRGQSAGVQGVIYGTVNTFESYRGGSALKVDVRMVEVATKQLVFENQYSKELPSILLSKANVQEQLTGVSPLQRFLSWTVLVLLLPVFTIGFIRTMVRKESNRSNAFVLSIYTGVAVLLGYLLLGVDFSSWFSVLMFLVAMGAAFAYNIFIMTFALKLET